MRSPLRIRGRRRWRRCAQCGIDQPWPESFINRMYDECLACWLVNHPEQIEPMVTALARVRRGHFVSQNGGTEKETGGSLQDNARPESDLYGGSDVQADA